jgi:hypothetical protein
MATPPATTTPVWLTSDNGTVQIRRWVDASIATSVDLVVVAEGDAITLGADADFVGDVLTEGVALGAADAELEAETDSSPPPSTKSTVLPTTAGGDDGPSDRGALHAAWPVVRSTASTDSRPTTIASPSAMTGAGMPAA